MFCVYYDVLFIYWDSLPDTITDDTTVITVCRNDGCDNSKKIEVRRCGPYYVFKLKRLGNCEAYCVGKTSIDMEYKLIQANICIILRTRDIIHLFCGKPVQNTLSRT